MSINVTINSRKGDKLTTINISATATTDSLKKQFEQKFPKWCADRQYFTKGDLTNKVVLAPGASLSSQGIVDGDVLVFKDLGPQISWKTVFHIEYAGPILLHALCYYGGSLIYGDLHTKDTVHSYTQTVAFICVVLHYIKRELETHYVHRFSNGTMPFMNVFKNSAHYWLLGGLFIAYFLYHPLYTETFGETTVNVLAALFALFEYGNYYSHCQLRDLRAPGSRDRKDPRGGMFELTSCANYTYEVAAWLTFSIMVSTLTAWLFALVSTAQIAQWSIKKHVLLKKEFGGVKGRKILVPLIW